MMKSFTNKFNILNNKCSSMLCRTLCTVNQSEVNKFSKIGKDWWDSNSIQGAGPLHAMNPCRVKFIVENLSKHLNLNSSDNKPLKDLNILDVGCGGGLLSTTLARLGANVTAIDPSESNIFVAKEHSKYDPLTSKIKYQQKTIEEISIENQLFDVICSLEVIEHVEKPLTFINNCTNCLKDNGSLFISTINRTYQSYAIAILGAEYITGIIPKGTHDWKKFISPIELSLLIETSNNNMKINEIKGMIPEIIQFPPNIKWKLSDNKNINYIVHAIKNIK